VIDLSAERLVAGVARITGGRGVDVVIESVGGALTGQALATLALQGVLTSLGYSAGRQTTIDVTDLIWKRASMSGFLLFAQSHAIRVAAWATMRPLLTSETVKPVVENTYELEDAAEALRHLIEDRPFGRVVVAG
jgi:NADPH:quinone reductase